MDRLAAVRRLGTRQHGSAHELRSPRPLYTRLPAARLNLVSRAWNDGVAFWRKYDINTRVAISYPFCVTCSQIAQLVDAADHHHEPVRVHGAVRMATCQDGSQ